MDEDFRGLNNVRVKTTDLIEKITENRNTHVQTYKDALEGYFIQAEKKLSEASKKLKKKTVITSITFEVPVDHTKEYDQMLAMLKMSQDEYLVITKSDYRQYVEDEWISDREKSMLRTYALSSSNSSKYVVS